MRILAALLLAALLVPAGCKAIECKVYNPDKGSPAGPSIDLIEVAGATHGDPATVTAEVRGSVTQRVERVRLHHRSRRDGKPPFSAALEMDDLPGSEFRVTLPALNVGPYEVCVHAELGPRPPQPTFDDPVPEPVPTDPDDLVTLVDGLEFAVGLSGDCHHFGDEALGEGGWTVDGFYDADEPYDLIADVAASYVGRYFQPGCGWGLTVLPLTLLPELSVRYWRFDYISPDLSDRPEWQDVPEILIRYCTNASVELQPIYTYLYEDGSLHTWALGPVDDRVFFDVDVDPSQPHYVTELIVPRATPGAYDSEATLVELRIRVFGEPSLTYPLEFFSHLMVVCPFPERPAEGLPTSKLPRVGDFELAPTLLEGRKP